MLDPSTELKEVVRPAIVLYAASVVILVYNSLIQDLIHSPKFRKGKRFLKKGPFQSIECLFEVNDE